MEFLVELTPSYDGKRWQARLYRDGNIYAWSYHDYGSKNYLIRRNKNRLKRICVKRIEWLAKQAQKNNNKGWNTAKTERFTVSYKWVEGGRLVKQEKEN